MVNLKRIGFQPEEAFNPNGKGGLFSSAAIIIDEDLEPSKTRGKTVAVVFFSPGGHVIYQHYPGKYKYEELLVAAEFYVGETFSANRWKVYTISIERPGGKL